MMETAPCVLYCVISAVCGGMVTMILLIICAGSKPR